MSLLSLRSVLETHQVAIYFAAVVLAGALAWLWPESTTMSPAIDPLLAFMLFVTFLQVPLTELRRALSNMRFLGALMLANFVAVPLLVAVLLPWMPQDPLLRIGVLLVLLTPCIDYVVTFAHLGQADAKPLLASTPLLLAAQMILLPVYLGVFMCSLYARLSAAIAWLKLTRGASRINGFRRIVQTAFGPPMPMLMGTLGGCLLRPRKVTRWAI